MVWWSFCRSEVQQHWVDSWTSTGGKMWLILPSREMCKIQDTMTFLLHVMLGSLFHLSCFMWPLLHRFVGFRVDAESQLAFVFAPPLACEGLIPPLELLGFPISCLYPQLFVLTVTPPSCPLSRTSHCSQTRTHTAAHCGDVGLTACAWTLQSLHQR